MKEGTGKLDFIKIKNFHSVKDTVKIMRREATDCEKIFEKVIYAKDSYPNYKGTQTPRSSGKTVAERSLESEPTSSHLHTESMPTRRAIHLEDKPSTEWTPAQGRQRSHTKQERWRHSTPRAANGRGEGHCWGAWSQIPCSGAQKKNKRILKCTQTISEKILLTDLKHLPSEPPGKPCLSLGQLHGIEPITTHPRAHLNCCHIVGMKLAETEDGLSWKPYLGLRLHHRSGASCCIPLETAYAYSLPTTMDSIGIHSGTPSSAPPPTMPKNLTPGDPYSLMFTRPPASQTKSPDTCRLLRVHTIQKANPSRLGDRALSNS